MIKGLNVVWYLVILQAFSVWNQGSACCQWMWQWRCPDINGDRLQSLTPKSNTLSQMWQILREEIRKVEQPLAARAVDGTSWHIVWLWRPVLYTLITSSLCPVKFESVWLVASKWLRLQKYSFTAFGKSRKYKATTTAQCVFTHNFIWVCVCVYICIYTYIHTHTDIFFLSFIGFNVSTLSLCLHCA